MNKKIVLYILIFIIIIASFLMLFNLSDFPPGLYPDEAMNGNNALESLHTGGWKVFYPENNGREGLFMNIQAIFLGLFGNKIWTLRLVSALFGILMVLGIYFLTKELFNNSRNIALLSSFFAATSFWIINFSRIGFRAIMAPMFLVWALYFLISAFNKIKEGNPKSYILNSIFSGVFYGLGFYSYIAYRATPLLIFVILLFYWFKNKDSAVRKKILLVASGYILVAIIIAAPLGLYFINNPQD
ncbi:MAG TPA: glycosyltransferase family 39 protein, partial [Candidatus Wolfebacteria bacterium]|nr:glycosyltransferase family 39 protein [Candidatus Wolfebacteria bacterium]